MRESGSFDWAPGTAAAWRAFQALLADRLAELAEDAVVLLEAESATQEDGAPPYVQFWRSAGRLRCEAASNHSLAQSHRLDEASESALLQLGFAPPGSADEESGSLNFSIEAGCDEGDRLAVLGVTALRDVYAVPHPAFLTGDRLVDDSEVPTGAAEQAGETSGEPAVYPVHGPEHLQRLVEEALTVFLGHPPEHDEDGDIPVTSDDVTAFVSVLPDRPVVRVLACLGTGIEDSTRADFEVGVLNRDVPFLKFFRRGRAVFVQSDLVGWPFVGDHLRQLVERMFREVGELRDDLLARLADRAAEQAVHPAMLTLLHLDDESPGSVAATLAASICDHDRDLVLELLRWNAQQESAWQEACEDAVDDGELDLADVCRGEVAQAVRMTGLLRSALRAVVEGQSTKFPRARSGRHDDGHRRGRRMPVQRTVPDPTLEEVDPEMWG